MCFKKYPYVSSKGWSVNWRVHKEAEDVWILTASLVPCECSNSREICSGWAGLHPALRIDWTLAVCYWGIQISYHWMALFLWWAFFFFTLNLFWYICYQKLSIYEVWIVKIFVLHIFKPDTVIITFFWVHICYGVIVSETYFISLNLSLAVRYSWL